MVTFPVVQSVEENMSMLKREMKVQKDPTKRLKSDKSWGPSRSGTEEEKVSEFEDIAENGWYETEGKRPKKKNEEPQLTVEK